MLLTLITIYGLFYFVPTIVAGGRKHPKVGAILGLNFFLGWTVVGWVLAFIWAISTQSAPPPSPPPPTTPPTRVCLKCGTVVIGMAHFCSHCGTALPVITSAS